MAGYPSGPKGAIASKLTGGLEKNNHLQGRTGAETPKHKGPANRGVLPGNPTSGGGINRPTKGRS